MCNECFFFSTMKHDLNYPESSLFRKTEGDSTHRVDPPPLFHPVIGVQSLLPRSGWGGGGGFYIKLIGVLVVPGDKKQFWCHIGC